MADRLTLVDGEFYGWTMYPGYGDSPYLSPIEVLGLRTLGGRCFELQFLNVFYAAGMQKMGYTLRTLRRERSFLVAEQVEENLPTDRVVVIENFTPQWFIRAMPQHDERGRHERCFDAEGKPRREGIYAFLASSR